MWHDAGCTCLLGRREEWSWRQQGNVGRREKQRQPAGEQRSITEPNYI